jgi:hypothetical protein
MKKTMAVAVLALGSLSLGGMRGGRAHRGGRGHGDRCRGTRSAAWSTRHSRRPQANVKKATYSALGRMQIKVVNAKRDGSTEVITAKAADREIEIELEALTPNTTRMLVVAKKDGGVLRDSATATEIILQTEKIVGQT